MATPTSPRGFESAEADEAIRASRREEARRFRASDLTSAFPRRDVPAGCGTGTTWSHAAGTCVAVGGAPSDARAGAGALDVPLSTLFALALALALAGVLFLVILWVVLAAARLASRELAAVAANASRRARGYERGTPAAVRARLVSAILLAAARALAGFGETRLGPGAKSKSTASPSSRRAASSPSPSPSRPSDRFAPIPTDESVAEAGAEDDDEEPSGVKLGSAMGSALARLSRAPTFGSREANAAASEMASALTAYLEAGEDAADEFRAAFVDAADRAFDAEAKTETKAERTKTDAGEKSPRQASDSKSTDPIRATNASSPSSSSTSDDIDAVLVDASPTRGGSEKSEKSERCEKFSPKSSPSSSASDWFSGFTNPFSNPWTTAEDAKSPGRAGMGSGGSPGKRRRNDDDSDPFATFAASFAAPPPALPDVLAEDDDDVANDDATRTRDSRGNARRAGANTMRGIMAVASAADDKQLKVLDLAVRMREVLSSERANDIAEKNLHLSARALETQRLNLSVLSENNEVHSRANVLAAEQLEGIAADRRATAEEKALSETRAALADSFYAGLAVIFATTLAGGWRRATAALTSVVSVCPAPAASTTWSGLAWSYVGGGVGPLEYAWCVAKSLVGAAWGGALFAVVAWKLLQHNVVTRFQAAPATVALVVLGAGCGYVGRNAVDSLGGDGGLWLRLWRAYVASAAAATWRAANVRRALARVGPAGRVAFHVALGGLFPFAVGALPFEDVFSALYLEASKNALVWGGAAWDRATEAAEIIGFGFVYR